MTRRIGLAFVAALAASACQHTPVTEVVVVIDTDVSLPAQADTLEVSFQSTVALESNFYGPDGVHAPDGGLVHSVAKLPTFPATIGVVPTNSAPDAPFDVTVTLTKTRAGGLPDLVVRRKASDVLFVRGETRALFVSLLRQCVCTGTSCPAPVDGTCADLSAPTLTAFDPAHLPRVPADGGAWASDGPDAAEASPDGGGVDDGRDGAGSADVALETAADVGPDAATEAMPDLAADRAADTASDSPAAEVAPDAAADAGDVPAEAPALFARGHACTAAGQCLDALCVDGFCCESQCACGTCGGATPGTCVPAPAATDPHAACGAFTCNGAGACETTCAETFGACSTHCRAGAFCDGAGLCKAATAGAGFFCVTGSCMCQAGLTCAAPDAGGAGKCE